MSVTRFSETSDLYIYEATEGWYILGCDCASSGPIDSEQAVCEVRQLVEAGAAINRPLEDIIDAIREGVE